MPGGEEVHQHDAAYRKMIFTKWQEEKRQQGEKELEREPLVRGKEGGQTDGCTDRQGQIHKVIFSDTTSKGATQSEFS